MLEKAQLRTHYLAVRRSLAPEHMAIWSQRIVENIIDNDAFVQAKVIMGYLAMPGEPNIDEALKAALRMGKIVCVPAFTAKKGVMLAARLSTFDDLVVGAYGIRAVPQNAETLSETAIDLILTPGLVFTGDGARLGLGGGYYDRFLPLAANACRMGVLFECFLRESLPLEEHDMRVHCLAMESRVVRCDMN